MTKHTSEIFEILRRGKFICSNSPDNKIKTLYMVLESESNFNELYEYFKHINYILEQGDEYFYFSLPEVKNIDIENKIKKALEWIDILDFFTTYNSSFDVGFRFSPSEIAGQLKNNADLKDKLSNIKGTGLDDKKYLDRIKKLISKLEKDNYIALENKISEEYKVLTSFNYLKDLVDEINISGEIENETFE
jgi:hypothetical protein